MKQTVGQVLLLKRPKQAYEAKSVQHLASHEPKGIALLLDEPTSSHIKWRQPGQMSLNRLARTCLTSREAYI